MSGTDSLLTAAERGDYAEWCAEAAKRLGLVRGWGERAEILQRLIVPLLAAARAEGVAQERLRMPVISELLAYEDLWGRFMNALAGLDALEAQCAALQARVDALDAETPSHRANVSLPFRVREPSRAPAACRTCGHDAAWHVRLPGHPDGAEECYASEDCECGRYD
jgi:hypothetical protein